MNSHSKNKGLSDAANAKSSYTADVLNPHNEISPFHIGDLNPVGVGSLGGSLLNWPLTQPYPPASPLTQPYTPATPFNQSPYTPVKPKPSTFSIATPPVVEPNFKLKDLGYSLKLSLLGYNRKNITMKVVNGNLALVATDGGLEGNEAVSYCIKIPKDADMKLDAVLLNGVLTITTPMLLFEETAITIR